VGGGDEDGIDAAAAELQSRLEAGFRRVRLGGSGKGVEATSTED
jgi:hypothetical protein